MYVCSRIPYSCFQLPSQRVFVSRGSSCLPVLLQVFWQMCLPSSSSVNVCVVSPSGEIIHPPPLPVVDAPACTTLHLLGKLADLQQDNTNAAWKPTLLSV
jgi:hypothetical protein